MTYDQLLNVVLTNGHWMIVYALAGIGLLAWAESVKK